MLVLYMYDLGADPGFFLGGVHIAFLIFFFFCRIPVLLESHSAISGGGGGVHPLQGSKIFLKSL